MNLFYICCHENVIFVNRYLKVNTLIKLITIIPKEVFSSGSNRKTVLSLQAQKPRWGCDIFHCRRCLPRSWTKEAFQFLWHAQRSENNYCFSELVNLEIALVNYYQSSFAFCFAMVTHDVVGID